MLKTDRRPAPGPGAATWDGVMHRLSLNCFGVGDGWPCAIRKHSSFLYQFNPVTLLLDCGEPVSGSFKATGLGYDAVDRILLSHLHCDHIGGFFMLMQGYWLENRRKPLWVHLPEEGIQPIQQMLNAACIFKELLPFRLEFIPWKAGEPVITGPVRVTPYPTTHLHRLRQTFQARYPQAFAAYCFLLETDRLRVGHSADIGTPEDLAPLVAEPLDLLVCELAHCEPLALFEFLRGRSIRRLLFIHLDRQHWQNLEATRALAATALGSIPFSFAHNGEEVRL